MNNEVTCPYCNYENEIDTSDGEGCEDGVTYELECYECEREFTYVTSISVHYRSIKKEEPKKEAPE